MAGIEPAYEKEFPQRKLLSKCSEVSSNTNINTTGLRGIVTTVLQKCSALLASMLIPSESQINTLERTKKSLIVPDVCVDVNIDTPILEAVQGKAKLTIPDINSICDESKSALFGNCMLGKSPLGQVSCNCLDIHKISHMPKITVRNKKSLMNENRMLDSLCKTKNIKNRKEKDRHTLQINIMEVMWDDYELDSDNHNNTSATNDGCSFLSCSSDQKSSPVDLSEASYPPAGASIQLDISHNDLPKRSSECDSEESFVMVYDMRSPWAEVCSTRSMNSAKPNNRQRYRQVSECSDDSVVFCYENDAISQSNDEYDYEEDSEEEETDEESSQNTLTYQPDSGFEEKKVQFNPKPQIHVMRTWDFAYRQARKGEWEMAARDRERFKKRISESEAVLSSIFDKGLRDRVYLERFSC